MCPLRRVEDHRAGPSALGILVPPGRRTFLILRPRSLSWDLVLLRPDADSTFRELRREEANALARELSDALTSASAHVEEVSCPDGCGLWVRARLGTFALLVCGRLPGQPYQPLVFAEGEAAQTAIAQLRVILCPSGDIVQEVYLNTQHFTH